MTVIRVLCIHGFRQQALQLKGRTRALEKRLRQYIRDHSGGRYRCDLLFDVEGPHTLPHIVAGEGGEVGRQSKPRRAWLVTKEQYHHTDDGAWVKNTNQILMQTEGWKESLDVLEGHLDRHGPFDCMLGFSQGAAVAGLLAVRESARPPDQRRFKSVIIVSGYVLSIMKEFEVNTPAMMPSLHVFGGDDKDSQVPKDSSLELAEYFDESARILLQTDSGHLIPSSREYVAEIGHFLLQQCASIS